jgi:hypothetical protein
VGFSRFILEDHDMRSPLFFASLLAASAAVALVQIACGGDDNAPATTPPSNQPTVQDSGGFGFSDAESGTTIAITGAGTVFTNGVQDSQVPPVTCASDGTTTTGNCKAEFQDTLYAVPANGWSFSHWDPGAITGSTFYVGQSTPNPLTAVFVADNTKQPDAAPPPPPPDAGVHDTGTDSADSAVTDTGPQDTGADAHD